MKFTLAFGAVGDFIAVLELIKNIIAALDDSHGSTKAYRDVVQSLGILESTLRQIEQLRAIALRNVEQIKRCLAEFNNKIEKFGPSLTGAKNALRGAARKVQWRLEEKDVDKFRWELLGHTMAMNTLLELTTFSVFRQTHHVTIKQISDSENRTRAIVQNSNQSLREYLGAIGQRVLSRIESISHLAMDLKSSTSQLLSMVLSVSGELGRIRAVMMRLERPLSDEHVIFEDATGKVFPIHLRTITSWEIFEFIITDRFKGKKGAHQTRRGRYTLQERATGREVDRSLDWENAFYRIRGLI
ncbi:unnamed protein product [Colletotrichum noveboracense]|uniref:Ubiquitin-like domain-containing protein n=1 Tax=Colletotrichum noveboracense TaxID=2664923 RepID=A0A9W4RSD8_9PEZI|nr:unnamed protein product [Colletotrichum noveboracense]